MNETQAKVCLFVAIFKFKVALLDRVTQTVQTSLRSDRDYNTTIGSVRGYGGGGMVPFKETRQINHRSGSPRQPTINRPSGLTVFSMLNRSLHSKLLLTSDKT